MFFKKNKQIKSPEGMTLLMTAYNSIEAGIVSAKIEALGIPVVKSQRKEGAYLTLVMGKSYIGVDLYVPLDKLEEAQDAIKMSEEIRDEDILNDPSFTDEALTQENEEFLKKLNRRTWIMGGLFFACVAILIYFVLTR